VAFTPPAAVVIPTHNRIDLLRKVLDSVIAQSVQTDVLVMDDASSDGTQETVRGNYPNVRYFREEIIKGPIFQRNKAAELTEAKILFTIDDDCILSSPGTLEQTLAGFDHPRVAAVTMPFINVLADSVVRTAAPGPGMALIAFEYLGGMVAIRRDVYRALGGYRTYMFMHVEEPDLAIRMLDAGYLVRLGWADPITHMESPLRDFPRRRIQGARSHILNAFYNVPWPYFPLHLAGATLLNFRQGLRLRHPLDGINGTCQGYFGMLHELGKRQPVSRNTYCLARMLKRIGSIQMKDLEPLLPPMRTLPA
jgi:glycosyltransferase involved in cell wall biosynthesis